jgi:hypothetical protein
VVKKKERSNRMRFGFLPCPPPHLLFLLLRTPAKSDTQKQNRANSSEGTTPKAKAKAKASHKVTKVNNFANVNQRVKQTPTAPTAPAKTRTRKRRASIN